ncbi:MAG: multi-sensor hybrid histidine kinase [Proteobacteria bacterium]|nr:multi-sensor hybrid histidine kinase [Pseudomonadota bacterium]
MSMRTLSIRKYLGFIIFLIALVLAVGFFLFKVFWFDAHVKIETEQRQLQVATVLSKQVKIYLDTPVMQLKSVALQRKKAGANGAVLDQALDAQVLVSDVLEVAYVLDQSGHVRAHGFPQRRGQMRTNLYDANFSADSMFVDARTTGKLVWSNVFFSELNQQLTIAFSFPDKEWTFIGEVGIENLIANLKKIAGNSNCLVLVVDINGQVILDQEGKYFDRKIDPSRIPEMSQFVRTRQPVFSQFDFDDEAMQGVMSPIEGTNWALVYAEPVSVANATSRLISRATIAFFLASLLGGVVLVVVLSKKVAGQFATLAERAARVAAGEDNVIWPDFLVSEFSLLSVGIQHTASLLLERERRLKMMIENLPGVIYRARNDEVPERAVLSQSVERLTGYGHDELQSGNMIAYQALIHRDDRAYVDRSIRQCIEEKKSWQLTYRIVTREGAVKWVCDYGWIYSDQSNGVIYREGFIADITETKCSADELSEYEARLHTVLGNLPVVLEVVDKNGIYTLSDGKGLAKIGLVPGQLVGQSLHERFSKVPEIRADVLRCLAGESIHNQMRVFDNWYEMICEPVIEADGQISGAMIFSIDVSLRKNAEDKLLRMSSLLKGTQSLAKVGGWELDVLNSEMYWSDEMFSIYEVSPEDYVPSIENNLLFFVPESRDRFASAIQKAIDTGQNYDLSLAMMTGKGNTRMVRATCETIKTDGKTVRIFGALQDISAYKRIENELLAHKLHLEETVDQRTHELVQARDVAEHATQAKSVFLANTSHEIRTPINAVIGLTRLALKAESSPKLRSYLEKIHVSAGLLLDLINDILDFSKIEAGRLDLVQVEFNLADVLEKISTVIAQRAGEKNIDFLLDIAPQVNQVLVGDPMRLSQVLINLCGNAVKFTERGEIVLSVAQQSGEVAGQISLQFTVKDSGIGLSPEDIERLFQPFNQVDSSNTRRYGGTGLGLAISRLLVEMMGGKVWAESEPGRGSTFKFTASFGVAAVQRPAPDYASSMPPGLKALVVEQSACARAIHATLLASLGCETLTVASLDEAQASLQQGAFDLVLLDARLFDADQQTVLAFRTAAHPLRVVVMVADVSDEQSQKALASVDAWVSKPVMVAPLYLAIMTAFGQVLRVALPPSGAAVRVEQARAKLSGSQVLLAEDNEFNQLVACELLADVGIKTTLAGNGQQAVELALAGDFDLVLMDIQMPLMDGFGATRRLRDEARLADLPIIAMTAHAMVAEHDKCLSAGMNDFLSKPVDPDQLYAALMRWIKHSDRSPATLAVADSSAPASDALPAEIAGISLRDGLRFCGGKTGFYLKMLQQFRQSKADLAEEIRACINAGDLDAARRITHTNKSIAAHIGAGQLADAARALEKSLQDTDGAAIASALAEFTRCLSIVIEGLQQALAALPARAPAAAGEAIGDLSPLLQQLSGLLQRDLGKALRLERKIRPALESGPLANDYAAFRHHLEVFDTHAAAESLSRLIDAYREKQGV